MQYILTPLSCPLFSQVMYYINKKWTPEFLDWKYAFTQKI